MPLSIRAAAFAVRVDRAGHEFAREAFFGDSRRRSVRHRQRYSGEAHQVAGGHSELELLIDATQSAKHGLSNPPDGLAPPEVLLDPFADDLADAVTQMAGRTAVDRAATATGIVGSDVGRDLALATLGHEIVCVVGLLTVGLG